MLPIIGTGFATIALARLGAKELGLGLSEGVRKNFNAIIDRAFDKLNIFADKVDFIGSKWIHQAEHSASNLIKLISHEVSEIIDEVFEKANLFITNFARTTLDDLIIPTLNKIQELENFFFQELNKIIDQLGEVIDNAMTDLKGMADKLGYNLEILSPQNWLEKNKNLVDIYEKKKRNLSSQLSKDTPVKQIVTTYGQLQYNALEIMGIFRKTEIANVLYAQDYVYYGQLTKLWSKFLIN